MKDNLTDEAYTIVFSGGEPAVQLVDTLLEEIKELRDKVRNGVSDSVIYSPVLYVGPGENVSDALDRLLSNAERDSLSKAD